MSKCNINSKVKRNFRRKGALERLEVNIKKIQEAITATKVMAVSEVIKKDLNRKLALSLKEVETLKTRIINH